MKISKKSRMVCGILLILMPTVMYGGIALLGILTEGTAGIAPGNLSLSEAQWEVWRAGHAQAGVLVILSLILQLHIESIELSIGWEWTSTLGTPAASILVSGGFFGLAFIPALQWLLYVEPSAF